MGTSLAKEHAQTDLALRASSYGMAAWPVDGMDVLAVEDAATRACEEIRGAGAPVFLELRTYRFRAHSMYDPDRYRTKEEVAAWRRHDPLPALQDRMRAEGLLDDDGLAAVEAEVAAAIAAAVEAAEGAPAEEVEELTLFVTSPTDGSGR
jgi:pyruvate dehydrogenase E1 component alpha subunit